MAFVVVLWLSHPLHTGQVQLVDLNLRVMDSGGQTYFEFLKPVLMQDRALVLLCVNGREDATIVQEMEQYLDILSTLMHGGVVIPVVTHADEIDDPSPLRSLWSTQVEDLFSRFQGVLTIDTELTLVSSSTGQGLGELREKMRRNAGRVSTFP